MEFKKQVTLVISLDSEEIESLKSLLKGVIAANVSVNQGLGFLDTDEKKLVENLIQELK
jgi:hypothetical protein